MNLRQSITPDFYRCPACQMLPSRHIPNAPLSQRRNIAAALLIALLISPTATLVLADEPAAPVPAPSAPAPTPPTPAPASPSSPLDESIALQAFPVIENWVRRGSVPQNTLPITATDVAAVHVTVRLAGAALGQGTASLPPADLAALTERNTDDKTPLPSVDVMNLLRQATGIAIREATASLGQPLPKAEQPVTVDIQLAHVPRAIHIDRLEQLPNHITLGVDGLAMSRAEKWTWMMPGTAIASNTNLRGILNRLLTTLEYPLDRLPDVGTTTGPRIYKFRVIHIARAADAVPISLYRGNPPMQPAPLDQAALNAFSDQLREYILHRQTGTGTFRGTYEPTADRFVPLVADEGDIALAAVALARIARVKTVDAAERTRAADAALKAVNILTAKLAPPPIGAPAPAEEPLVANDLNTTALTVLALLQTPGAGEIKAERLRLTAALTGMQRPDGLMRNSIRVNTSAGALPSQAIAAAALVALYDRTRDPQTLNQALSLLAALWPQVTPDRLPFVMPFLADAELELERLGHPSPTLAQLKPALDTLWKRQVQAVNDRGVAVSPDIVGGFLLGEGLINEPTSQSAAVLAAQARAMRSPKLVADADRPRWIVRCALAARFLDQLAMQPDSCFYVHTPKSAISGIRIAMWNNHQPLAASAMSLIAVAELQQSLAP